MAGIKSSSYKAKWASSHLIFSENEINKQDKAQLPKTNQVLKESQPTIQPCKQNNSQIHGLKSFKL